MQHACLASVTQPYAKLSHPSWLWVPSLLLSVCKPPVNVLGLLQAALRQTLPQPLCPALL